MEVRSGYHRRNGKSTLYCYFVYLIDSYCCSVKIQFKPSNGKKSSGQEFSHTGPDSTFAAQTVTGPAIYHFGIIDFLQNWTFQKRIERAFKIYFLRKDPDGLSVMHPTDYKLRFQGKVDEIFDLDGKPGGIGSANDTQANTTPSAEVETTPVNGAKKS